MNFSKVVFVFLFFQDLSCSQDSDVWAAMSDKEAIETESLSTLTNIIVNNVQNHFQAVDLLALVHGPVVRETFKEGAIKRWRMIACDTNS